MYFLCASVEERGTLLGHSRGTVRLAPSLSPWVLIGYIQFIMRSVLIKTDLIINWIWHRGEIVQRGNRHLDNLNFCVTPSTQVPRATQNLPASAVAEIS
jgi:hypothetical protein